MKLEDLPETLTPAVLEGGYLLYVCREGWAINPDRDPVRWGASTTPGATLAVTDAESVVHLLEYPARPVGWYHLKKRGAHLEEVLWWDGAAWRERPYSDTAIPFASEDGVTISSITINDKENNND